MHQRGPRLDLHARAARHAGRERRPVGQRRRLGLGGAVRLRRRPRRPPRPGRAARRSRWSPRAWPSRRARWRPRPTRPFSIDFDNEDAGTLHNVAIKDGAGTDVFSGEIFPGIAHKTYDVKALAAGTYSFHCVVHSNMVGTLTVK